MTTVKWKKMEDSTTEKTLRKEDAHGRNKFKNYRSQ